MGAGESKSVPEDIVEVILKRLPVKTVIRFKSVCKSWKSLISSPNFIKHYHISNENHPYDHRIVNNAASEIKIANSSSSVVAQFKVPESSANSGGQLQVVGSFNGLICVYHCTGSNEYFYLWNPAVGIVKTIDHRFLEDYHSPSGGRDAVSLGFVPDPNYDFKIVRITTCGKHHPIDHAVDISTPIVDVYSVRTNSWRKTKASTFGLYGQSSGAYVNGALHWLSCLGNRVIAFDITNEVFRDITLPGDCSPGSILPRVDSVFACQDFLVVLNCFRDFCNIWVMNEYGVSESWSKLYVIELSHNMMIPAFWKVFGFSGATVNYQGATVNDQGATLNDQGATVNGQVLVKEYADGIKQALVCMDFQHMTSFEILSSDVCHVAPYRMSLLTFDCIGLN